MSTTTKDGNDVEELAQLPLLDAVERSFDIVRRAIEGVHEEGKELVGVHGLYSGGNDSTTFMHLMAPIMDGVIHVNTGIGIPETRLFVRQTCLRLGLPLREYSPEGKDTYEALVTRFGFPGPGGHPMMYRHLKERQLRRARREIVTNGRSQRVIFLAGMRYDESKRRFRNANEVDREGSIVFVSPIVHWTRDHMVEYRKARDIPRNPVSDHLHMSGECLCGAFAKPGELEEIRFWYPEVAAEIDALQGKVKAAGQHCVWGTRPPRKGKAKHEHVQTDQRLCHSCVANNEDTP